jgi:hypothetical protein
MKRPLIVGSTITALAITMTMLAVSNRESRDSRPQVVRAVEDSRALVRSGKLREAETELKSVIAEQKPKNRMESAAVEHARLPI